MSIVAIKLRAEARGAEFKQAVAAASPGLMALEIREFNQSYPQFQILHYTAWVVGLCAFLLGGLGVANTMRLSVFSCIREIAVLRVCGFSRGQVTGLIFGDALVIAAAGLLARLCARLWRLGGFGACRPVARLRSGGHQARHGWWDYCYLTGDRGGGRDLSGLVRRQNPTCGGTAV